MSLQTAGSSPREPLAQALKSWCLRVEHELDAWLPAATAIPCRLHAAQRYSVLGPGKRIRPALVYATATTLGVPLEQVDAAACAVELIHCYSLVHDDLPAMDDDDLRRGRPTCHRQFDEATAILAGDSLQVLAFHLLASHPGLPSDAMVRVRIIDTLAVASGTAGMAGGQALDLAAEGGSLTVADLERLHALKTGALIRASVLMAAHCRSGLGADQLAALGIFGERVGLAFQVQDDILDVEGDVQVIGKPPGSDQARGMPTYPAITGMAAARARVRQLHDEASRQLAAHGWQDSPLADLSHWLLTRNR
ncbi:MAG: polyprenyl synthetase family protein [Steroidobacteraceae bacterium]|nr:polyprenyl synthetase family protein [Steroidobacteraceae bacterium]